LNKYPKLRSVLQYGLKNFNNLQVEWVPGSAPTAYFYDQSGAQVSEAVLGDRTFTELLALLKEHSFTPTLDAISYPDTPLATREYGGPTYHFYSTENPYQTALDFAKSSGGYMVTVTSAQEQDFLGKALKELNIPKVWLGASDREEDGIWKWNDGPEKSTVFWTTNPDTGSAAGYSFWFKGEPNNIDTEDCAQLFPDGWNDVSCEVEKTALVVEIGNEPLQEPPVSVESENKPDL